jgi:hypothetical protein
MTSILKVAAERSHDVPGCFVVGTADLTLHSWDVALRDDLLTPWDFALNLRTPRRPASSRCGPLSLAVMRPELPLNSAPIRARQVHSVGVLPPPHSWTYASPPRRPAAHVFRRLDRLAAPRNTPSPRSFVRALFQLDQPLQRPVRCSPRRYRHAGTLCSESARGSRLQRCLLLPRWQAALTRHQPTHAASPSTSMLCVDASTHWAEGASRNYSAESARASDTGKMPSLIVAA